jgi:hypothetical protein
MLRESVNESHGGLALLQIALRFAGSSALGSFGSREANRMDRFAVCRGPRARRVGG